MGISVLLKRDDDSRAVIASKCDCVGNIPNVSVCLWRVTHLVGNLSGAAFSRRNTCCCWATVCVCGVCIKRDAKWPLGSQGRVAINRKKKITRGVA
jgi:hypothetical protein